MNVQDKLERILREMHILLSRAPSPKGKGEYVLIQKKEMQRHLGSISQAVREMMDEYEATQQSRNRKELEAENQRLEILRNANHQAQDIYAASVIYSEDALGRIQDIISQPEQETKKILKNLNREMEEEKRRIRSNQTELITQLEDMKDTAKYMRLIEDRNREIAKEKAKKQEKERPKESRRREEREAGEKTAKTETEIIKETAKEPEERIVYEKPVIKINSEYFKRAGISADEDIEAEGLKEPEAEKQEDRKEKMRGFFSFGKKP